MPGRRRRCAVTLAISRSAATGSATWLTTKDGDDGVEDVVAEWKPADVGGDRWWPGRPLVVEHRRLDVGSDDTGAVVAEDGADRSRAGAGVEHEAPARGIGLRATRWRANGS